MSICIANIFQNKSKSSGSFQVNHRLNETTINSYTKTKACSKWDETENQKQHKEEHGLLIFIWKIKEGTNSRQWENEPTLLPSSFDSIYNSMRIQRE